jgi:hypothetical protein
MEPATSSRTLLPRLDIPANALCTAERDPVATAERTRWLMVAARAQRLRADKAAARKRADDRATPPSARPWLCAIRLRGCQWLRGCAGRAPPPPPPPRQHLQPEQPSFARTASRQHAGWLLLPRSTSSSYLHVGTGTSYYSSSRALRLY